MHYISEITVTNFKSIKQATFRLEPYTPIVGYNNAGKSNIVSALKWLLQKEKLLDSSFNDSLLSVEVEGVINGVTPTLLGLLPSNQQAALNSFVENEKLIIKRVQDVPNATAREQHLYVWHPVDQVWKDNPTGLDQALAKLFPEAIQIVAMMDAAEDVSKFKTSSTIGKLISEIITPIEQLHGQAVIQALSDIKNKFDSSGVNRVQEFVDFDKNATEKLQNIFPDITLKLHIPVPEIKDLFKMGTIKVVENNIDRDISSFGHGTQRSVQMALLRQLAEEKLKSSTGKNTTTLLLIDEPELYLHPQAIEQVRSSLKILSKNGYQIIFSTHSPQMIPAEDIKNTLLIKKDLSTGTTARQTIKTAVEQIEKDAFSQYQLLFSLENSNQVLFSEGVILAEGKTEKRLLPRIFEKKHDKTLGQKKLALVDQNGVDNTVKTQQVLSVMNIPSKAIVDLDFVFRGAIKQGLIAENDPSIVSCKSLFVTNSDISIDSETGLPNKKGKLTASEAFEWLAVQPEAVPEIEKLHLKLKNHNIWVWKKGAIEPHLNLHKKNEAAWAEFIQELDRIGIDTLTDSDVLEMLDWIAN